MAYDTAPDYHEVQQRAHDLIDQFDIMHSAVIAILDSGGIAAIRSFFDARANAALRAVPILNAQSLKPDIINPALTERGLSTDLATHFPAINAAATAFATDLYQWINSDPPGYAVKNVTANFWSQRFRTRVGNLNLNGAAATARDAIIADQTAQTVEVSFPAYDTQPADVVTTGNALKTALENFGIA